MLERGPRPAAGPEGCRGAGAEGRGAGAGSAPGAAALPPDKPGIRVVGCAAASSRNAVPGRTDWAATSRQPAARTRRAAPVPVRNRPISRPGIRRHALAQGGSLAQALTRNRLFNGLRWRRDFPCGEENRPDDKNEDHEKGKESRQPAHRQRSVLGVRGRRRRTGRRRESDCSLSVVPARNKPLLPPGSARSMPPPGPIRPGMRAIASGPRVCESAGKLENPCSHTLPDRAGPPDVHA